MLPRAIWGEGVPKPTGNAPRGGSIEGRPNFVWVILGDLDRFKRARVLGFIRPVVPLAGLLLYCPRTTGFMGGYSFAPAIGFDLVVGSEKIWCSLVPGAHCQSQHRHKKLGGYMAG